MQHAWKQSRVRVSPWALAILAVALVGVGVISVLHALTAEECEYFAQNGKVRICEATTSAQNPYVPITVSVDACVQGHAEQHPADYIAAADPQCQGTGCLPAGAPCDATFPCCEGLACTSGVCTFSIR